MDYNMSDSEQIIMEILWNYQSAMTISEMGKCLQQEYRILWKRQTINTFLARLIKKGLVLQNGRNYNYTYTQREYEKLKAEAILKEEYGGSFRKFVSALSGSQSISKQEYEDLLTYLDSLK